MREDAKLRVRELADIVQVIGECVELKKSGPRFMGRCPFHAEKTPSFTVHPHKRFYHCFGCGESGDVFSFMMKYHGMTFPEALKELARRYRVELPEPKLSEEEKKRFEKRELLCRVNAQAAEIYHRFLLSSPPEGDAGRYLAGRGVPLEMIKKFRLGFAPDPKTASWTFLISELRRRNLPPAAVEEAGLAVKKDNGDYYDRFRHRVLFPIEDMTGRVVAFGGRLLGEGRPKYMNSPESMIFDKSRLLFGLYQNRDAIRRQRRAVVVEGYFDLLLLAVHGIDNVVAPLGTSLTQSHIRSLRGYCEEVVLLFDGDGAGLKAAMRSIPFFLAERVNARVALLPTGHDPDSLVRERGAAAVEELVAGGAPLSEFVFDRLVQQYGLTLEGKHRIISELHELIKGNVDSAQRSLMAAHFSEKLGLDPTELTAGADRPRPREERAPKKDTQGLSALSRIQRQAVDFIVLYPEFFTELRARGLEAVLEDPQAQRIFYCIGELHEQGEFSSEQLLSGLLGTDERGYVAELLLRNSDLGFEERETKARVMRDELFAWLNEFQTRRQSVDLQEQINQAQQAGDMELLMELLKKMQEMRKISNSSITS